MTAAGQDVTMRKGLDLPRKQSGANLTASGEGGCRPAQAAEPLERAVVLPARADAGNVANVYNNTPMASSCKVRLRVAVFFDGTGNNMDADVGTKEHSNVARLFRSHVQNDPDAGIYAFYAPGLGTYFREIGDPGDEDGTRFGARGEDRLVWAMKQIDSAVSGHKVETIVGLDIALFGFSRGATLARAFARRLQDRVHWQGGKWMWDKGSLDTRIYFMGIFDTVASVGLPTSTSQGAYRIGTGYHTIDQGLQVRRRARDCGLDPLDPGTVNLGIAFGAKPGADPAPGSIDGHNSWASDLRLPPLVQKCVHFVAGNEVRNSFPLDSARDGQQYPSGVDERVYPGAHSNVGGGYRPGEGGKSKLAKDLLSIVPLRAMHDAALTAGVPLLPKAHAQSEGDFDVSPDLIDCYNAFVSYANANTVGASVEARLLSYMRIQHAWRFKRIRERGTGARHDAGTIKVNESQFAADTASLDNQIAGAEKDPARLSAQADLKKAEGDLETARAELGRAGQQRLNLAALAAAKERFRLANEAAEEARERFSLVDDARMKLVARKATLPGTGLIDRLSAYDRNLLLDVQAILNVRKLYPNARLRPHYKNLIEAYEAEYVQHRGLLDDYPKVLALFDNYVHDSLAGFAKDQTLPSDPRVVYIGGDKRSQFAQSAPDAFESMAA